MIGFVLFVAALWAQGIPVPANQGGTITGTLRTAAGTPAAGVRVSALTSPESTKDLVSSTARASLAETDNSGRYRLENIPPGRYYVVAGNIDVPTFYPGTVNANEGVILRITPGLLVPGIDFAVNNISAGRAAPINIGIVAPPSWIVPMTARIEGGGAVPTFITGWFPFVRFSTTAGKIEAPLTSLNVTLTNPEYRVTVEGVRDPYVVKSVTFGTTNLLNAPLQLSSVTSVAASVASVIPVTQTISVILERRSAPPVTGVRVSGKIQGDPNRSIYISGLPGTVYADGVFEFVGVPQGRHSVVTLDNPGRARPLGASIVVGNRDLSGVELEEVSIAPFGAGLPSGPSAASNVVPTSRTPLAAIRGRVLDAETNEPLNAGRVIVNKDYSLTFPFEDDGRFEIPKLLPGSYSLEIVAYGVGAETRTVELDDKNAELDLRLGSPR